MYIFQSHVLKCELYEVLEMMVDELYSTVEDIESIDKLHAENKMICLRLAISKDAKAKAEYRISMAKTIQKLSVKTQKQVKLKLKVCEDMAHAQHKKLTEALAEFSKAKELLAKLGVSGYADLKGSAKT
ncbi:Uncharacterized protein Fot_34694 [Forsythia ovata]|uniref:Uncharacterized protein n=1 Tax=Forsythia ovata TaxID=205694 RepID=A0ABD1SJI9_9LAMI